MNELYDLPDLDDLDYISDTTTPLMARADGEGVALSFGFDADWLTALLQRMQADGKIMRGQRIDRDTWSRVSEVLRKAVDTGYAQADAPSADEAFRDALHHSTDVFAAFKVHRMQHDMAAALTDEKGDLKPFNQWLNDVQPIASHQVGAWLETEYNTAVIRAHQAADWQQFEAEKDVLPNLKWNPSTSAHPGADHMPFWGVVRPVDDPFWSQHRPGDRWNCKCSLSSTDEPATALPEGYDTTENAPQPGLKDNPGKTGEIFSPDNNYVREAAPGAKEAVEKLMEEVEKDETPDPKRIEANKKQYQELKKDSDYHDVRFDEKKGGVTATHKGHKSGDSKKAFFNKSMSGADLEKECTNIIYNFGHSVILCDESKTGANGKQYAALDIKFNGKMMDIRSITGSGEYVNALVSKNKQLKKYNARPDIDEPADSLCLYFHDPTLFSEDKMLYAIEHYKTYVFNDGRKITPLIKNLYVVIRGENEIRTYKT